MAEPDVHMFGKPIPREKERKFMLFAAGIGIVGVVLVVLKNRASGAATSVAGANQPSTSGSTGSGAGTSTGTGTTPPSTPTQPLSVELKFSESTSPSLQYQGTSGRSGSASGGFSFGGFSLGGGGGSSSSSGKQLAFGAKNEFSADTIITGGSMSDVQSIMTWLTGLAGTQQQRSDQAIAETQSVYPYVSGGHTVAGDSMAAINQSNTKQAIADAKAAVQIAKIRGTRSGPTIGPIVPYGGIAR